MANAPRDTEPLQLRLEKRIATPLRTEAKKRNFANVQELIRKILEDFLERKNASASTVKPSRESDIDLRALLLEAHKNISELTKTITAMVEERKNALTAAAAPDPARGSTAPRLPRRGGAQVVSGLRGDL